MLNPIFGGVSIARLGTPAQKAEMLPGLVSGQMMFAMALTEPDAGSNSLEVRTFAAAEGSGWRLSGQKVWITCVPQADKILVVARTKTVADSISKTDGISLFMIDREREGLTHRSIDKVGTKTLPSSIIFFDNVRVEEHELIGTLHSGFRQLLDVLNTERIVTTAGLVGTAKLAEELAVSYAADRKIFGGKPIGSYQALQFPLAESRIEAECARLMNGSVLHDMGKPYGSEANMAKYLAGHAAGHATEGIQTMADGYRRISCRATVCDARLFRSLRFRREVLNRRAT
jgi:acyl-CoA dehydrogenase